MNLFFFYQKIKIKNRSPIFNSLIENIFENTISNILTEAFNKEFSLTSRPRLIALPPKLSTIITEHPATPINNNFLMSSHGSVNNSSHSLTNKSKITLMNMGTTEPNSLTYIENSQVLLSSRDNNETTNNNNNGVSNNNNTNIMQIA